MIKHWYWRVNADILIFIFTKNESQLNARQANGHTRTSGFDGGNRFNLVPFFSMNRATEQGGKYPREVDGVLRPHDLVCAPVTSQRRHCPGKTRSDRPRRTAGREVEGFIEKFPRLWIWPYRGQILNCQKELCPPLIYKLITIACLKYL